MNETPERGSPPPPRASPAPAQGQVPGDDFMSLVAEYDRQIAGEAPPPQPAPEIDEGERLASDLDNTALRGRVAQFETARRVEAATKQAGEDEGRIFAAAREAVAGFNLPPDYERLWLQQRWNSDPELQKATAAWYRGGTPAAKARAERAVNLCLKELHAHAKSLPDPYATADRDLVTQAVRGNSMTKAPAREKNYGGMSNGEFKLELAALGIENSRIEG